VESVININNTNEKEKDWVLPPAPNIDDVENHPTVTKTSNAPTIAIVPQVDSPNPILCTVHQCNESEESQSSDDDSTDSASIQEEFNTTMEVPPGSLFDNAAPPPSPTNVCDYPYFEYEDNAYKYSDGLRLEVSTRNKLPRIKRTISDLSIQNMTSTEEEEQEFITSVVTESLVADIGSQGYKISCNRMDRESDRGKMADTGANCSMTNNLSLLRNVTDLLNPIQVGVAVDAKGTDVMYSTCTKVGELTITCTDGSTINTKCFHNPHATDTIISPQAILDESTEFDSWSQVGRRIGQPGELQFHGKNGTKSIALAQHNGLYYCKSVTFDISRGFENLVLSSEEKDLERTESLQDDDETPLHSNTTPVIHKLASTSPKMVHPSTEWKKTSKYKPTTKAKILESETWALRMGGCSETALSELPKHAVGLPSRLEWHPFRYIDFAEQARVRKQPAGRDPDKVTERAARVYLDYGFIRASNEDYSRPDRKKDRIVESYDGYTSYLLVVDEVSKYAWIFLTKSKEPPVEICRIFFKQFGNVNGGIA